MRGIIASIGFSDFMALCWGWTVWWETAVGGCSLWGSLWTSWWEHGSFVLSLGAYADGVSGAVVGAVCAVSFCVRLYSAAYMQYEPWLPMFLGTLGVFVLFMLVLIGWSASDAPPLWRVPGPACAKRISSA